MTDRDGMIELIEKSFAEQYEKRGLLTAPHTADDLLANGAFLLPEDLRGTEDFSISAFIEAMQMYKEKDRYIKLPCEVGDKAWFILELDDKLQICEETVVDFSTKGFYYSEFLDGTGAQILVPYEEIGKTVFLTKEEAEAELEKRGKE